MCFLVIVLAVPTLWHRAFMEGAATGFGSNWEQMGIARSLAAGQGFANPFDQFPTGPTGICAPLHPWLLAGLLWLFGDHPSTAISATILEIVAQTGALVLLLWISAYLFEASIPGAVGAALMLLVAIYPVPQWENGMAWLAMEAVFIGCLRGVRWLWLGAGMGVAWLLSPALSMACIAVLVVFRGWRQAALCAGTALLVISPWLVRNSMVMHAPSFVRDGYGLELYMSNNDLAGPLQQDAPERYALMHPSQNADAALDLRQRGEANYFALLQSRALDWIRTHPRRFLQLTAARIGLWWGADWRFMGASLLGGIGLWMLRRSQAGRAAAVAFLIFPLPYYFVQYDPRYSWSVLWLVMLLAGYTCWRTGIHVLARIHGSVRSLQ